MKAGQIFTAIQQCFARQHAEGRVTIALSGGMDSMVLLDAVAVVYENKAGRGFSAKNTQKPAPMLDLHALHIHHGLSPNADAWADFCQAECDKRNIPLTIVRVAIDRNNTDGLGIEGAARRARYAAFATHGAPTILAAQHADDQAETVLHQLLRGTGLAGLSAMGETRTLTASQRLVRPLLHVRRAEIEAYAREHKLNWIEDESNADTTYTRNFIRHALLPQIATRFPHYNDSLSRLARHAAESAALNEAMAQIDLKFDGTNAHADALDQLDLARQTNALYHWLRWQHVSPPSSAQLEEWARQLFRESPTDKPHQAGGHDVVIRRRGHLLELVKN